MQGLERLPLGSAFPALASIQQEPDEAPASDGRRRLRGIFRRRRDSEGRRGMPRASSCARAMLSVGHSLANTWSSLRHDLSSLLWQGIRGTAMSMVSAYIFRALCLEDPNSPRNRSNDQDHEGHEEGAGGSLAGEAGGHPGQGGSGSQGKRLHILKAVVLC